MSEPQDIQTNPAASRTRRAPRIDWVRWAIHVGALLPAVWILVGYLQGTLTVNPFQTIEQRTGRIALILPLLSLACTPINLVFGWRPALRHRRTLGLYAFAYAATHLLILIGLDYGFNFDLLRPDLSGKPFIWVGALALLILAALAAISFTIWKKRLGKNWKRLHRLVYLAVLVVILHFAWARKGSLTTLSGDILQPLAFGIAAAGLLVFRLPIVRRRLAGRRRSPG